MPETPVPLPAATVAHVGSFLALFAKTDCRQEISKKGAKALYLSECEMATEIRLLPIERGGKATPQKWVFHELGKQKTKDSD